MKAVVVAASLVLVIAGCSSKKAAEPTSPPASTATTAPSPTASPCAVPGADVRSARSDAGSGTQAHLRDVRYATTPCPRVVFEFENAPPAYRVEYRSSPFSNCASGKPVDTSTWGATAYVVFHSNSASGVDLTAPTFRQTYTKSTDIAVSSRILHRIRETCDFEATLEWVIALDARHPFKVTTLRSPPRLVIDVSEVSS